MEPDFELKKVFRTTVFVNGAVVASLFLYALMVELIRSQLNPFPGLIVSGVRRQTLRYFFFGAAAGAVILVRLASRSTQKATAGGDLHHLISRLSRTSIITAALGELPAVLGFILFLMTGFSRDFYLLLCGSLFLEFMYFPRFSVWQDFVGERFPERGP